MGIRSAASLAEVFQKGNLELSYSAAGILFSIGEFQVWVEGQSLRLLRIPAGEVRPYERDSRSDVFRQQRGQFLLRNSAPQPVFQL